MLYEKSDRFGIIIRNSYSKGIRIKPVIDDQKRSQVRYFEIHIESKDIEQLPMIKR